MGTSPTTSGEARLGAGIRPAGRSRPRALDARLTASLALAAMLTAGCGAEPEPPVRIGTVPWLSTELMFLAQDRGMLDPSRYRLVEFVDDGEAMRAFRNHAVSAAWLSLDEALAVGQNQTVDPVILFVADESRGADAIVAQPDLATTEDLRDRRIAAQINSVNAFVLDLALKQTGLAVSDVRLVNLPPYRQLAAFMRREVDAVVTYEPVRSQILAAGGVEIYSSASIPFQVLRVFVMRRDFLESHEAEAAALCRSWHAGVDALRSSPEARDWIAHRLNVSPESLDRMFGRLRLVDLPESQAWLAPPRPRLLATLARLTTELTGAGLMTSAGAPEAFFRWPSAAAPSACRG